MPGAVDGGQQPAPNPCGEPSQSKLQEALGEHISKPRCLPGDTPPPDLAALGEAAQYLLAAAHTRKPGESLVQIGGPPAVRAAGCGLPSSMTTCRFWSIRSRRPIAAQGIAIDSPASPGRPGRSRSRRGAITAMAKPRREAGRRSARIADLCRNPAGRCPAAAATCSKRCRQHSPMCTPRSATGLRCRQAMSGGMRRLPQTFDMKPAALLGLAGGRVADQLGHLTRYRDAREGRCSALPRFGARNVAETSIGTRLRMVRPARSRRHAAHAAGDQVQCAGPRVHRRSPLDLFMVPQREKGRITALSIHAGLWTSAALSARPAKCPCCARPFAH